MTDESAAVTAARWWVIKSVLAYYVDIWEEAKERGRKNALNVVLNKPLDATTVRPGDYKDAMDAALADLERIVRMEGIARFVERLRANGHWQPEWWIDDAAMDDPAWQAEARAIVAAHPEWLEEASRG